MTEIIFDKNEDWEKRILCSDESCIGTIGPMVNAGNAANLTKVNCLKKAAQAAGKPW